MKFGANQVKPRIATQLILLLTIVLLVCGHATLLLWQVVRNNHYHYIHKHHPKADTLLVFNPQEIAQIQWFTEDEVRVNGNMFDIKKTEFRDGKLYLYGFFDKKDDALFTSLQLLLDGSRDNEKNKQTSFWWYEAILLSPASISFIRLCADNLKPHPVYVMFLANGMPEVPSPPPEHYNC